MNYRFSALALVALALVGAGCEPANAPLDPAGATGTASQSNMFGRRAIPGKYIVVLKDAVGSEDVQTIVDDMSAKQSCKVEHTYRRALKGFSAEMSADAADRLSRDSRVKYIEPDYEISIDPTEAEGKPTGGGGGSTSVQITSWGVTRVGGSHDGTGKTAWIIDSGIDMANPDLNVDAGRSRNFVVGGKNSPADLNGHGTHVAGIVGAKNNSTDAVGVAANATLVSVRVLDNKGTGTTSWLIAGIDYVASTAHAGDVANISITSAATTAVDDALRRAAANGILFTLAAGNDAALALLYSPARVDAPNVYTVSAITSTDAFWSGSNYGTPVDYAAPGVNIPSSRLGGGVVTMTGTSMAAPHVCGLLLLNSLNANGTATGDPDGVADPIAHY